MGGECRGIREIWRWEKVKNENETSNQKETRKSIAQELCVVSVARSSSFVFICEEKLRAQRDDKQTPNSMI